MEYKVKPGWNRCVECGKFITYEDLVMVEFIPDTPFTIEKATYMCRECYAESIVKAESE
jgi:uncharacterized protein with PIN domain